jgi:hypothetical protein
MFITSFTVIGIFRNRWSSRSNDAKINGTERNKMNGTQRC